MSLNIKLLSQPSNITYDTTSPYSYTKWLQFNSLTKNEESINLYNDYLRVWNELQDNNKKQNTNAIKQDYINLLKELTLFFSEEEKNLFLKDIDFTNDVELIYAIPSFVQKLKEIALTVAKKRESIKNNRHKYSYIGTDTGIENILYEYILKAYTKSQSTIQLSISSLGVIFPELSAVKDDFFIEIEDLYQTTTKPSSTSKYPRVVETPLFNVFNEFLNNNTDTASLSSYIYYTYSQPTVNEYISKFNKEYLGNNIYGISALKYDITNPNDIIDFTFSVGNNWFYWPKSEIFTDVSSIKSIYDPILINDAKFTEVATAGTNYTNSDLLFVESRNNVEGAWLRGSYTQETSGTIVLTVQPNNTRTFIYPVPGYGLTNTYKWSGRELNDGGLVTYNLLDSNLKQDIVTKYFTSSAEDMKVSPLYINNSSLLYSNSYADTTSFTSDNILKRPQGVFLSTDGIYRDSDSVEQAFFYKLTSCELPIKEGKNYILWPLTASTSEDTIVNVFSAINTAEICSSVQLNSININKYMTGAIAGLTPDTADVIYKISSKTGKPIEVAWLQGNTIDSLASVNSSSIQIYDSPAVNCTASPQGAIQPSLNFICKPDNYVSFVWCDVDTPADDVFKYIDHAKDCPFILNLQDYKNSTSKDWSSCTCKAVYYSPIGHAGEQITDFNGVTDYLFADPQNLGEEFTLTKWRDTRNLIYKNSPQFSFFKKTDNTVCKDFGWGPGTWKTGSGHQMILKTGRRYTYFRNNITTNNLTTNIPPLIGLYDYKNILTSIQTNTIADIVLLVDISGSQFYSINKTKELIKKIIELTNTNNGSQISIIAFSGTAATACYLTTNKQLLLNTIDQLTVKDTNNKTNINAGLEIAQNILTNIIGTNQENIILSLCSNLTFTTQTSVSLANNTNIPQKNSKKTLIIFSDGEDNISSNLTAKINNIKNNNTQIVAVDIGPNSKFNLNSEFFATDLGSTYFNYEDILKYSDTENIYKTVAASIISSIYGSNVFQPIWVKAAIENNSIVSLNTASDMILNSGDYFIYDRKSSVSYTDWYTSASSFIINTPLYGWNYNKKMFDRISLGARPYWGKSYNSVQTNLSTRFAREFGGHVRFVYDYLPVSHPEISTLTFNVNDYIEYKNNSCDTFIWKQDIKINKTINNREWLKLKVCVQDANLRDLFSNNSLDKIVEETTEPSNIQLQTFTNFTPSYYCYYALNRFTFKQPLIISNNINTYSQIVTGVAIEANKPHSNLLNTHYSYVFDKISTDNLTTFKEVGGYLLPVFLGVPFYLGYGSVNTLNTNKLASLSGDILYLNPSIYTSNRGLTEQDQISPFETTYVDNSWIKEPYNNNLKSGVIINAAKYQKFVPYQSLYESINYNPFGLSRQTDNFEFWDEQNQWNDEQNFPLNYKKEPYKLKERTEKLLVTDKTLYNWQTDIYGNNYGLLY